MQPDGIHIVARNGQGGAGVFGLNKGAEHPVDGPEVMLVCTTGTDVLSIVLQAGSRKNAYDIIAGARTDYPLISVCRYFSTPAQGGLALIYAYELTKKPVYLAASVQGANYSLGANPDNLSYCTGVGYSAQHFNFIVDVHVTGQLGVMIGHIPYGQGNEGNAMSRAGNGWVQTWLLDYGPTKKMIPNWYNWPVNEQYIDFARNPLHNENCFNQTTVPAACYWFYLAARQ